MKDNKILIASLSFISVSVLFFLLLTFFDAYHQISEGRYYFKFSFVPVSLLVGFFITLASYIGTVKSFFIGLFLFLIFVAFQCILNISTGCGLVVIFIVPGIIAIGLVSIFGEVLRGIRSKIIKKNGRL